MPKTAEKKLCQKARFLIFSGGNSSMAFLRQEIIATKVGREKVGSSAGKVGREKVWSSALLLAYLVNALLL